MHTNISLSHPNANPFESIKRHDAQGNEYWMAKDLLKMLGYKTWKRIKDTVERAKISATNSGVDVEAHFPEVVQMAQIGGSQAYREVVEDYKLSRHAAYLVAMNGDPRKPEIAAAQAYFAVKTREAEVVIPQQAEELERMKLMLQIERERNLGRQLDSSMVAMHGKDVVLALRGYEDVIVEVDRPITEVIDQRCGDRRKGMTTKQLNDYLKQKTGHAFKSGTQLAKYLEQHAPELLDLVQRPITQDFVNEENIEAVMRVLEKRDRQRLIGE